MPTWQYVVCPKCQSAITVLCVFVVFSTRRLQRSDGEEWWKRLDQVQPNDWWFVIESSVINLSRQMCACALRLLLIFDKCWELVFVCNSVDASRDRFAPTSAYVGLNFVECSFWNFSCCVYWKKKYNFLAPDAQILKEENGDLKGPDLWRFTILWVYFCKIMYIRVWISHFGFHSPTIERVS